ncbi:MAG: carbon-nitrogen hydrolase family protein [Alphaproteobacteria bacterium]|nr:MAG: carbon-nitrogen hydrolase family protein [Alphaproteobacteria bacterium]
MKVAVLQTNGGGPKPENVDAAFALMERVVADEAPDFIALPENFPLYTTDAGVMADHAEPMPGGPTYERLRSFARDKGVVLHAGSMSERANGKPFNTTVVFDQTGKEIARYRKIHRFDITAPDGTEYFESHVVGAGRKVVTYENRGLTFGCAICFDLRFGELFFRLSQAGADVIVIPSAFTYATGRAHWETLIRARAIEFQCYMLAPNQTGTFDDGKKRNWGHSMIVDPWGEVLASLDEHPGYITATIDKSKVDKVRTRIPVNSLRVL